MNRQQVDHEHDIERPLESWMKEERPPIIDRETRIDDVIRQLSVTPQHQARWLGRWFRRGKGATRSTADHGSPSEENRSTRRTRFMFSATGLVAGIAVLALAVNTISPSQDRSIAGAEDGVLVVAADGSGEYDTITAAVAAASDGDTITVMPGEYVEAIIIDKDIDLIGDGAVEDIVIRAPADGPRSESPPRDFYALLLRDIADATVSGLTFRGEPSILIISGGSPTIEGSWFEGTGWAFDTRGILLDGSSIQVNDGSTATITNNRLVDGGPVGVFGESAPVISGNTLSGGPHVYLNSAAGGTTVTDNSISGTLRYGINSHGDGVEISGNTVSDPGGVGIRVRAGSSRVADNSVRDARTGISVEGGTAEIVGNELVRNMVGIGGSTLTMASGNSIRDGNIGIVLIAGSAQIEDNAVEGNEAAGIVIGNAASPVLSGNIVCGNGVNLNLADDAQAVIDDTNEVCEDGAGD